MIKVLANDNGNMIIQGDACDLARLMGTAGGYAEIPLIRKNVHKKCSFKDMEAGDLIKDKLVDSQYLHASTIVKSYKEIRGSCSTMKGALTRMHNAMLPVETNDDES